MRRKVAIAAAVLGVVLILCYAMAPRLRKPAEVHPSALSPPLDPSDRWPDWDVKLITGVLDDEGEPNSQPNVPIPPSCWGDAAYHGRIAYEYAYLYKCQSDPTFKIGGFRRLSLGLPDDRKRSVTILESKDVNLNLISTHRERVRRCNGGMKLEVTFIVWWVTKPNVFIPPPPSDGAMDPSLPFWKHVIAYDRTDFTLECCCD